MSKQSDKMQMARKYAREHRMRHESKTIAYQCNECGHRFESNLQEAFCYKCNSVDIDVEFSL